MTNFRRTISHWTGGTGRASSLDKTHYHFITEFDGTVVDGTHTPEDNIVTADDVYAAHTLNLNTGSIGCAMAGMLDAKESPFDAGPYPLNEEQFRAHCRKLAQIHAHYSIPVTPETCLTHAEVEPTLGVKQRGKWDIARLPWAPQIRGAIPVGNYMRALVREYMGAQPLILPVFHRVIYKGSVGPDVHALQERLIELGFPLGASDGRFGVLTEQAVMAFQADNGIMKDGVVGPQTWEALTKAEPRVLPESRSNISAETLLERGSETIKSTKNLKSMVETGGTLATASVVVSQAQEATDLINKAQGIVGSLQGILLIYWPLLVFGVILFMVWRYANTIEKARVNDARTGKNLGR